MVAQPSDSLSTNTFADKPQLGSMGQHLGWEATTALRSLPWGAGTSASTLGFVYQFLANEPFSSQKKVIQSDSKDES